MFARHQTTSGKRCLVGYSFSRQKTLAGIPVLIAARVDELIQTAQTERRNPMPKTLMLHRPADMLERQYAITPQTKDCPPCSLSRRADAIVSRRTLPGWWSSRWQSSCSLADQCQLKRTESFDPVKDEFRHTATGPERLARRYFGLRWVGQDISEASTPKTVC